MIVDEDFMLSLPNDPEEAFPLYEQYLNKVIFKSSWSDQKSEEEERDYVSNVFAFIQEHNIDIGISHKFPPSGQEFSQYYEELRRRISFYSAKCNMKRLRKIKSGTSAIYVLPPSLKQEIHHYLDRIREIIASADITDQKRDALARKLNAFSEEVDRDRTKLDALAAAFIWTKREVKDGVDALTPVLDKILKIMDRFTKAKELADTLPAPARAGELEPPQKRLESSGHVTAGGYDDLDDEVPF